MARGKRGKPREELSEEEAAEFAEERNGEANVEESKGEAAEIEENDAERELLFSKCKSMVNLLMQQKQSWPFNQPVDPEELEIPDYPSVIKHPMDLGTIKVKLDKKEYRDVALEFAQDVRLTFDNAMLYNPPGHEVHTLAKKLLALFEKEWKAFNKTHVVSPASTPKARPVSSFKLFSFEDKQKLLENLQLLPAHMQHDAVALLMKDRTPHVDWSGDEVDVQLDLVDNQTLQELDAHVEKCMKSVDLSEKQGKRTMESNRKGKKKKGKVKAIEDDEEDIGIVIDVPLSMFPEHTPK